MATCRNRWSYIIFYNNNYNAAFKHSWRKAKLYCFNVDMDCKIWWKLVFAVLPYEEILK